MTDADQHVHERWRSLADQLTCGETLTADELAFLEAHAASCSACGREAALFAALEAGPPPSVDRPPSALVDEVLRGARDAPAADRRVAPRSVAAGVVGGVAAAALALMVWKGVTAPPSASVEVASGYGSIEGRPAGDGALVVPGARLQTAQHTMCLKVSGGVRFCLEPHSVARLGVLNARRRVLHLDRGSVVARLEKQPPGRSVSVETRWGRAVAVGTEFRVRVRAGTAKVEMLEGTVRLEPVVGPRRLISAPARASMGRSEAPTTPSMASPAPTLTPSAGPTLAGEPSGQAAASAKAPKATASASAADSPGLAPGPTELLHRARQARIGGRLAEAAAAYRELQARYPRSPEAPTVTLSLASIELSRGNAAIALKLYDGYLRGAGGLAQEAEYGRIQALRALGNKATADEATRRFLERYPESVQARTLRR